MSHKCIVLLLVLLQALAGCSESAVSLYEDKEVLYGEYLIFDRMTGGGYTDLYVCFKDSANIWTEAVSLGDAVNTGGHDTYPYVTGDQMFLFFLRSTNSGIFPFWVDAGIIDALR